MPEETSISTDVAAEILSVLGADPGHSSSRSSPNADVFQRGTREQLLACAKRLGLTKVSRLTKEALARHVQVAFEKLPAPKGSGASGGAAAEPVPEGLASFPEKFDLGPDADQVVVPRNIPWGYGQDRVTGMVVDPDKMFVYWEVTDDSIQSARRDLGRGGASAWLNLRVYDVSGRLFDGTNAHSYFDHKLERWDRQWFFDINKPTSTACVEVGLRSTEGFFVKIARSGRIEFPRREPVGSGQVEWLTVHTDAGHAGDPIPGTPPFGGGGAAPGSDNGQGGGGGNGMPGDTLAAGLNGFPMAAEGAGDRAVERRWEWHEGERGEWQREKASVAWTGPVVRSAWEAGPFAYPVESPRRVEEHSHGQITTRTENGHVHIVTGPWQVIIRGVEARAERRVLATWQVFHSWSTVAGAGVEPAAERRLAPGSSEWLTMGASELRLGGASEIFTLGASELRFLGASETMYGGASEYRYRGASEQLYAGASERLFAGASERLYVGASEQLYVGASETRGGDQAPGAGASENEPPRRYPEKW